MRFLTPLLLGAAGTLFTAQAQQITPINASASHTERDVFISEMRQRLAINNRSHDPFGLAQKLEKKKRIDGWDLTVPSKTLSELISAVTIPLVDAKAGTFLMGSREFRTGEVFPFVHQDLRFRLRVKSVKEDAVTFEDLDSGKIVIRKMKLAPQHHIDFRDPALPAGLEEADPVGGVPFHLPSAD